jgi:hypothetical protein
MLPIQLYKKIEGFLIFCSLLTYFQTFVMFVYILDDLRTHVYKKIKLVTFWADFMKYPSSITYVMDIVKCHNREL